MVILFLLFCHFYTEYIVRVRGGRALLMSRKNAVLSQKETRWQEGSLIVLQFRKITISSNTDYFLLSLQNISEESSAFFEGKKNPNNGGLMRKKSFSMIIFEVIRLISTALVK